ncbi:MAG: rRNA maturation RNase YbeY [Candidatus Latescibacteria bacterium]|nr:rRNA maturation RNase YbeY [Candidatus Latescibacterota bacterium]
MPVHIDSTLPQLEIPDALITQLACRVLTEEGRGHATVTIVFVDDAYIRQLNFQYRQLNRATDVLSFLIDEGDMPEDNMSGELYVSMDRAREQAVRYHVPLNDELNRLIVHGCLHLLGYDHQRTAERRLMREKEQYYLADTASNSVG